MRIIDLKIQAGALQFATMMSVLIALLLMAFILLSYTHGKFSKELEISTELINLSRDGVYFSNHQTNLTYETIHNIELEHSNGKELVLKKIHWGIYDVIISRASASNKFHEKIAFTGSKIEKSKRPALYLQDEDAPLVVVGKTKISGSAHLPSQGIKAGNIFGHYYQGKELVYGQRFLSDRTLPRINNLKATYLYTTLEKSYLLKNNTVSIESNSKLINNSFSSATMYFYSKGDLILGRQRIDGNIIIKSDTKISVTQEAKLNNVILVAPVVEVEDYFEGSLQIIADKRIEIGEGSVLKYPSSLIYKAADTLNSSDAKPQLQNGILINSNAQVNGSVVCLGKAENVKTVAIKLEPKSKIVGELYSEDMIQVKGEIIGTCYTRGFLSKEKGSVYANHLFDANLNSNLLSEKYVGLPIEGSEKSVVQWLE